MPRIRRFALALVFASLALSANAFAQTPAIEVSTDTEAAEFSAQGKAQSVHVEVFAPSGELVFETDDSGGQSIRWPMVNQRGERVPDGVYLATITVTDVSGKRRKRIEQVIVSADAQREASGIDASPSPTAVGAISGEGTAGKLAKFTGANTIDDSAVTESTGRIGVNISPTARLHVNAATPAPVSTNGTAAVPLLQTSGGKGGNTTGTSRQTAGAGASISLVAGQGGDAPAGSINGRGGSITLQPGSAGAGAGFAGLNGNVLLAPGGVGNVGIGTSTPAVSGLNIGRGVPGGQARLQLDNANGRFGGLNRWTNRLELFSSDAIGLATKTIASPDMWIEGGKVGVRVFPLTTLHVAGDVTFDYGGNARLYLATGGTDLNRSLEVRNSQPNPAFSGLKVGGITVSHDDAYTIVPEKDNLLVRGRAAIGARNTLAGVGLYVVGTSAGVQAETSSGYGLIGAGPSGGVYARRTSNSGHAGYFDGPVQVNGQVCAANVPCSSDARLKQGVSNLGYGLNQLLRLRPVSWRWKSEPQGAVQMGLVAQEVEPVMPELVIKGADPIQPLGLNYMALLPVAIKAIQEQQAQIKEQRAQLQQQQQLIGRLQSQLAQVRRAVRGRAARR